MEEDVVVMGLRKAAPTVLIGTGDFSLNKKLEKIRSEDAVKNVVQHTDEVFTRRARRARQSVNVQVKLRQLKFKISNPNRHTFCYMMHIYYKAQALNFKGWFPALLSLLLYPLLFLHLLPLLLLC